MAVLWLYEIQIFWISRFSRFPNAITYVGWVLLGSKALCNFNRENIRKMNAYIEMNMIGTYS